MSVFARRLIDWQRQHGRHDLPWQGTSDAYRVWLSEIMLQQTQVATVIPYYQRFLERFPTLGDLAAAPVDAVMSLWSGLGYYARARNLHKCAQLVTNAHSGHFPETPAALAALPGIGPSTANAIAVFCFGARAPILDGNVKRVLCRFLGIEGFPGTPAVIDQLWQAADALLPHQHVGTYIQAQMDIGATICTRSQPRCDACPVADLCLARRTGRTADLPTPRMKKPLPERRTTLLVLRSGKRILLEARPPEGIWGGLLSLPELPAGESADDYCRRRFNLHVGTVSPVSTFSHGFTHFRLHITPLLCAIEPRRRAPPGLHWLDRSALAQAALPAPIRKLLLQMFSATP